MKVDIKNTLADGFKGERAIITPYNIRAYQSGNEITKQMYITHIGYYPDAKCHYRVREEPMKTYLFIVRKERDG